MNSSGRKHLQKILNKNLPCYVLISCGEPSKDGRIKVEMSYHGDATLASYITMQGAQLFIDQEEEEEILSFPETNSTHVIN